MSAFIFETWSFLETNRASVTPFKMCFFLHHHHHLDLSSNHQRMVSFTCKSYEWNFLERKHTYGQLSQFKFTFFPLLVDSKTKKERDRNVCMNNSRLETLDDTVWHRHDDRALLRTQTVTIVHRDLQSVSRKEAKHRRQTTESGLGRRNMRAWRRGMRQRWRQRWIDTQIIEWLMSTWDRRLHNITRKKLEDTITKEKVEFKRLVKLTVSAGDGESLLCSLWLPLQELRDDVDDSLRMFCSFMFVTSDTTTSMRIHSFAVDTWFCEKTGWNTRKFTKKQQVLRHTNRKSRCKGRDFFSHES